MTLSLVQEEQLEPELSEAKLYALSWPSPAVRRWLLQSYLDQQRERLIIKSLVSVNEAARMLGVSRRTIFSWIKQDRIRCIRTAGGHRRIETASLIRSAKHGA